MLLFQWISILIQGTRIFLFGPDYSYTETNLFTIEINLYFKIDNKITSSFRVYLENYMNRNLSTHPGNAHAQEEPLSLSRSKQAH